MTSYLLAGPAEEPLTLDEAKAFVRVDGTDEDPLVTTLITAARLHVESLTGRALIAQSWRLVLDAWPACREVHLPVGPLLTLTAITAYDDDGVAHAIAFSQFQPETDVVPARLFWPDGIAGLPTLRTRAGIEIDYTAGYGTSGADVPVDIRQALMTLVGYWFEHRDAVVVAGSGAVVPAGFDRLIAPYRPVRL